ncbi:aminotransferase [Candidatus Marinamargulisbacteria bacterium SCGC AG-333-B06]|nr:aminotransferase [Candidatus Marinamargulisbacteria bacterium SCGC AG-333-B06]
MNSCWPQFEEDEKDAVQSVLKSGKVNYWTGQGVQKFESEFAAYTGTQYAIAVSNGTVALELALMACDIQPGDEVIVPARTFLASASAVVMRGAKPVVCDIDLSSQCLTVDTVKPWITQNTKAIICVHLAGWPCDMDAIMVFAKERGLWVIEDCAQAHGALYKGKSVGSLGHMGAFSFCQDKIMTTGGEGGMVTTNDSELWQKMWSFKDHGKDYDTVFNTQHPSGFRWLHKEFGSNYRMTEMQSAIGRCQLKKLDQWNKRRTENAQVLIDVLSELDFIRIPRPDENEIRHANYKFYAFFVPEKAPVGLTRDGLVECITKAGITCMQGTCFNITYEDCFKIYPDQYQKELPFAKQLGETSVMLLLDHTINYECKEVISLLGGKLSARTLLGAL